MNESAAKTFMPIQTPDLHRVDNIWQTIYLPYSFMKSATQQLAQKKLWREENTSDASLNSVFLKNNNFEFWICMGLQKKLYEILKAYVSRVFYTPIGIKE